MSMNLDIQWCAEQVGIVNDRDRLTTPGKSYEE